MGESLNVVEPSGVAIRVAGSVVARPPRVRIDDIREGFVTVDPAGMRVPLEEAHVTSTVTTGWLFGRQVDVLPGRETRYVIAGYADESTGPPRGGAQLADDGSYRLATDDLSDLVALRAVVDTVISPPSGALAGAHLARAESGVDAPLRLASLVPVPVPASPTRPGLQLADGAVMPMGHTSSRMWSFTRGERSGREVDVLAEREGSAWIATDRPVRRGDRMLNVRLAAGRSTSRARYRSTGSGGSSGC